MHGEKDRKDVVESVVKNIVMSDCDVTRFLFSRALRSVVMLSSQKISNDMKTKTVSQESLSCKICKTLTNRANCNWWKCRTCPSVYVCDACMSSNVSTHHDETHEMIRCVPISPTKTMKTVKTTKMTEAGKRSEKNGTTNDCSRKQHLVMGILVRAQKREFQNFLFFAFLCHSNYKNITRTAHLKINARIQTQLERKLNSRFALERRVCLSTSVLC